MNISSCSLVVLSMCLLGEMNYAVGDGKLSESTYQDWSGVLNQVALPDGSFLFEYEARSFSNSTEGAMLAMTFVPRFHCEPMVTVTVPESVNVPAEDRALLVDVGGVRSFHDVVIESGEGYTVYAIAASVDGLVELRDIFDVSPRVSISVVDNAEHLERDLEDPIANLGSPMAPVDSVGFSLLGSRRTTDAVDNHCHSHQPVPYAPQ